MWVTIFAPLMVRGGAPSVGTEVQLLSRQSWRVWRLLSRHKIRR